MRRIIRLGSVRLPERFREVIRRIIREEEMMNSRWQANKIGLINFWYYDEQEFPFVKGRMLLRGSNGSGKSVTMQSVVPLLLDGNMSPERLDPFGSRDRKMSSYLLEEDDGREERTGYLYLEFKRQDTDTYLTIASILPPAKLTILQGSPATATRAFLCPALAASRRRLGFAWAPNCRVKMPVIP